MTAMGFFILVFILPLALVFIIIWLTCSPHRNHYSSSQYGSGTKYSQTRNPKDFDLVRDKDKIGNPAYPNALRDSAEKEWDEFRQAHNATLDPLNDDDWDKWIHPTS